MKLEFCTDIGFLSDVECTVDADLEFIHGQHVVSVNDVTMHGHSLFRSDDYRMKELAYWIAEEAETSERVRNALLEDAREQA